MNRNARADAGHLLTAHASRQNCAQAAVTLLKWAIIDVVNKDGRTPDGYALRTGTVCRQLGLIDDETDGAEYRGTTNMVTGVLEILEGEGKVWQDDHTWKKM